MYLADNIKFLRKEKGYQQDEVAKLLGVSAGTLSKYESGFIEPNLSCLLKLAKLYAVSLDDLILKEMTPQKPLYIKNLIWLRKSKGMTQDEIAKKFGFKGKSSWSLIEYGEISISVENLIRLADFYEVSLDDLVKKDLSKEV